MSKIADGSNAVLPKSESGRNVIRIGISTSLKRHFEAQGSGKNGRRSQAALCSWKSTFMP